MKKPQSEKSPLALKQAAPLVTAIAAMISISAAQASDVHWLSGTTGNWSTAVNWDVVPSITGVDTVIIDAVAATSSVTTTVDSGWATSGSVAGITFAPSAVVASQNIAIGTGVSLTVGAGGIVNNRTKGNLNISGGTLAIGTEQTWKLAATTWSASDLAINTNLSGTGNLILSGSGAAYNFQTGNSTAYTGTTTIQSSTVKVLGSSQLGRLGSNIVFGNGATGEASPNFVIDSLTGANQQLSFASNVKFANTGVGSRTWTINYTTVNSSLAFTGVWSGNLDYGLTFLSTGASTGLASDDLILRIQGNNSTLSSTKGSANQTGSAIYLRNAVISVEHANALGSGNTLSVSLGNGASTTAEASRSSLFAKSGITVGSALYANRNYNATANATKSDVVKVGIQETGSALFTGTMTLEYSAYNATTQVNNRSANVHLTAVSGGTASFTGNIVDSGSGTGSWYAPVTAEGGGVVSVSGSNSYRGGTSVIGSTTLLANNIKGSATGSGNVRVGYGSASVTGVTTLGSSIITGVDTANLVVGQTITGAGIPAGTIITFIHPTIAGRIEISQNATATSTGSVALTANAETGILGGTGRIIPGVVESVNQTITVANGSSIAPGAIGSIGSLTLDGTATGGTVLTMASGASFTFDLGTADNSDQLIFWNYLKDDLVLHNNAINLNGVQLGTFTLFKFYSDGGSTAVANSLILDFTSALTVAGYDPAEYTATLSSVDNTIVLSVASAVPEPSTWAMIVGGLGMLAFGQRIRRKE